MERNKVWFITGCSTGFGRELSKLVLELGYKAIVTARNPKDIQDITENYPDTSIPIQLDVTNKLEIENSILKAKARFGRIDILVNNAGIGYFGAIEESEEEEVRRMFEINFFGLANVTNAVLPIMRAQRNGMIINIASIGGLVSFPAVGFYNATKFAVDGYSEVLAKETSHLGIKVMIVAPSGFRTDWAGRSANNTKKKILDYEESAGANMQNIRASSGNQAGDPVRAVKAIVKAVESENPPMRLLLGKAALRNARNKLDSLKKEFDEWEETTVSADYPQ
ncbi:MAG TPA: oxidoreductase [Leptospiraceae bacterium]|nr:oxidoreductase [Leptospiraceae bacterium]HMW06415.1 oxidoreductase [Leptospiraceae bacterium]HMX31673.1 oxidoreductase [Leptospiraceae bacterium]HMY31959.1 oxidoreductase [Leptospiraceae bacterium]HMZ63177.1 oxidoreductase [Leptospiraceae bacterium]